MNFKKIVSCMFSGTVQNVSSGPYLCPKHTRCHSCDSTVPGNGLSVRYIYILSLLEDRLVIEVTRTIRVQKDLAFKFFIDHLFSLF